MIQHCYIRFLKIRSVKFINVWVTDIIKEQLSQHKLDEKDVYMKKLPKRKSKTTGHYYNDCAIVVDIGNQREKKKDNNIYIKTIMYSMLCNIKSIVHHSFEESQH